MSFICHCVFYLSAFPKISRALIIQTLITFTSEFGMLDLPIKLQQTTVNVLKANFVLKYTCLFELVGIGIFPFYDIPHRIQSSAVL